MIETAILAALLAVVLYAWRRALHCGGRAWKGLRTWEKILLVLCLAPVPGPLDEIAGGWLIARGLRRLRT